MADTIQRFDTLVGPNGRVEVATTLPTGRKVAVFVLEDSEQFDELVAAASTSLDFWDNPCDDEDWNDAQPT